MWDKDKKEFNLTLKYIMGEVVYIVEKNMFGRVKITVDEISYVSFTNMIHYHTRATGECFSGMDKHVFKKKEDAYVYAESLLKRKRIKFKDPFNCY